VVYTRNIYIYIHTTPDYGILYSRPGFVAYLDTVSGVS